MACSDNLVLILDQGGSSSRAIIFNPCGEVVASARRQVATTRPQPGWVEQSPEGIVGSLRSAMEEAVQQLDQTQRRQLSTAGLVCQRSSLLAWERDTGRTLTPILSWQDTRASDWLANQQLDHHTIQQLTGLYPNAHFGASKMRWCLDHNSVLNEAGSLALAPLASYLLYALLENNPFLVDPANASRTLLMNLHTQDWEPQLLSTFNIEQQWLPAIVPSLYHYGYLHVDGLHLPLRLLNGDQSAATFAEGNPHSNNCYINIGTGAFIYRTLQQPAAASRLLCSLLVSDGEQSLYAMEGTVNGAASALQWFQKQCATEGEPLTVSVGQFFQQQMSLPLFLNGIGGLGSPDWQANFPSQFVGQGTEQQRMLAIMESIAFLLLRNFQQLYAELPLPERMVVSGGLSRNDALCQLLANLTGVQVERVVEQESSARGAAFLLMEDRSGWSTTQGELFSPYKDQLSQRRYQQWTVAMEQQLNLL